MPRFERLSDYRKRLQDYVADQNHKEFRYGKHDCFTFAGGCIEAVTGEDVYSQYIGKYRTFAGGVKIARKEGFADQVDYVKSFGETVEAPFAQYGDLAIIQDPEADHLSVGVIFGGFAIAITETGIMRLPLSAVKEAVRYAA